ncbi:D-alanyl-D-alanine carboxypeptidase (penicillin-binding protein 5/6) [Paenibacillus sp. PvR052]|nr:MULTISPECIES: D-alanyl-D-alanine carboxypeptidase family protein [unclassified Paenibacillus]MBP1153241.1 D-alanyl-D-alanine carboxypeptidase (penicillin-binding protein 5/6) [Paenibacillus sp. PvP091]MBP1171376.1 D-alanyl-D-alanine carboxypeptidase (penicillin-binding protein 5/6) [Paenibacillus sp. PvR098]MBP2442404.1 D-alanyl-D-alanine carboxypeptidase (penicillin-binding protein 5/6) [Paenibacillus sp. PvP052]
MFRHVKRICLVVAVTFLLNTSLTLVQPAAVQAADTPVDLKLNAKSAILMEASTGQIIYEYNADEALPPASMAKMMTEYLVMDAVKSGKIEKTTMVTTSPYAAEVIGSQILLASGEQATVDDMFSALSIYSANDAAVALAEHIGGTEENFAKMMNEKAKEFGLSERAHFINSTGLGRADLGKYAPQELQGETLLTAKDAAIIAYHILKDHKEVLEYTKIPSKKFRERDQSPMINWNWMLWDNRNTINFKRFAYEGLDGLKTGSTNEAGYCFTGTAERNGMRLISVVMGTATEPSRFEETRKVLDYGFTNFELKQVVGAKAEIDSMKTVNIKKGVETEVPVVTESGVSIVAKKGAADDQFTITTAPADESKLVAPITKGQVLGTVKVTYHGQEQTANMVAKEEVEQGSWIRLFFRAIKDFFVDTVKGVTS